MGLYISHLIYNLGKQYCDAAPEKIEVFVDDQKVLVDPGTTILQVGCTGHE